MKKKLLTLAIAIFCTMFSFAESQHTFSQANGAFLLDGKPFVIRAAELHYGRIPHEYWEHRIKMCKALGMNTICLYVFWNYHEPEAGVFDFSGNRDLARFVGLCKKHGMWVILRPGPYTCAEWEMGGLPWWLLKDRDINLRSLDKRFMEPAARFEKKVADILAPYRLENGGNIIMVQVENEFGSYGTDVPYISAMRDTLRSAGWNNTQLFQCDWSSNFEKNALPDLLWTMNFGTNAKVLDQFKRLRQLRPESPLMCSEYWSGWFDGWGTAHQTRSSDAMVKGIETMLDNNISFSLYMTHGGTSFAWWAGANNTGFAPDCTSYDYDAPINEQGAATEKYFQLRNLLQKYSDVKLPSVPKQIPIITIPEIRLNEIGSLFNTSADVISSHDAKPIEQYDMGYGSILYTAKLPEIKSGALLRINGMHDYAIIYVNGEKMGQLYRGTKSENTITFNRNIEEGAQLDIYIEPMGRINYSKLINDPKGIVDGVELLMEQGGHELTYNLKNWNVRLFPLKEALTTDQIKMHRSIVMPGISSQPAYYSATFNLKRTGDTYLDLSTWGKGMVWVNGHCLGRFWNVGPQQTLYLPGCWLKKGSNEIIILDITGPKQCIVKGLSAPVIDELHKEFIPRDGFYSNKNEALKSVVNDTKGNDAAPGAK